METGNQLTLTLSEIKGRTVGLSKGGYNKDNHGQGLDYGPPHGDKTKEKLPLKLSDFVQIDRAVNDEQTDDCQPHGNLVANNLCRRAQSAKNTEFIGRRPACEDNAVNTETNKGQKPENTKIKRDTLHDVTLVTEHQSIGKGNDGKGYQGGE